MANIIQWFRQLSCKHEFELIKQGVTKVSHDASWKYKPTWVTAGYWRTYLCKKCLFTKNINTH